MPDLSERLATALRERYQIERELGRGGMALVFLAHDRKHERQVALKVLRPELAAALGPDRFVREIRIAAKLTHPHILPLYDSGEADGVLYYVMPFVEGESLRAKLDREGPLPLNTVREITRQVASALDYAHERQIVHRDIKPENILLSAGEALVADFGIAVAVSAAGGERLTETGLAIGTPSYMSPEQAAGERSVDARSDVYALACVAYHMLAGAPPFLGPSAVAVMARHIADPVPSLLTVRAALPECVEAAIVRALAKSPADRFATAGEFAAALMSDVAPSVAGAHAPTADRGTSPRLSTAAEQSIAVLPFANISADAENEYFCDGMTEEIINALAQLPALRVASRTSSFAFKGKQQDIRGVADALNVRTVLEGSVRRAGNTLRVTAQLISAADGYHLWSGRFDRDMADVFAIQDELARGIAEALRVRLSGEHVGQIVKPGTDNLEAYHLYLQGRHFWNQRALPKAIECFERAIAKDPDYALGYAGLADAYSFLGYYGYVPSRDVLARARAAAERAVASDPTLAEAHYSLGLVLFFYAWNMAEAERELRRAVELKPTLAQAQATLCQLLACFTRLDEAEAAGRAAQKLEPLSPLVHATVAMAQVFVRRAEVAVATCRHALDLDQHSVPTLWVAGIALSVLGRHAEAIDALERAVTFTQRNAWMLTLLGAAYAASGRRGEALQVLAELEQRVGTAAPPAPAHLAWIRTQLGQVDEALGLYEQAFEEHNLQALFPAVMSGAEQVRRHPRYAALLRQVGLESMGAGWE